MQVSAMQEGLSHKPVQLRVQGFIRGLVMQPGADKKELIAAELEKLAEYQFSASFNFSNS